MFAMITTHASLALPRFQEVLERVPGERAVIVADEVHHLGTDSSLASLPRHFRYRLGVSATPERWEDPIGSQRLLDYFGDIVFRFGIRSAIDAGVLCHYDYLPCVIDLTPDELEDYERVTSALTAELSRPPVERQRDKIHRLMLERSLVLDTAEGKLEQLRESIAAQRPEWALVYCANRPQLSAVMHLLWDRGIGARQFTGEEDAATRSEILKSLASGRAPALVAMKCLDEGVDVPPARQAYLLASSSNPMEFVQRRGRLLRPYPGKSKASIRDFVAIPDGRDEVERELLRKEVRRVVDFAAAADNRSTALDMIWPVLERNGLLDEVAG